jgi:hypothetical protein
MMLQVLVDGPAQSQGEWFGFAIIALVLACVPWAWRWPARRQGRVVVLREVVVASLTFVAIAGFSIFEALTQQ